MAVSSPNGRPSSCEGLKKKKKGRKGAVYILPHPFKNQDAAKKGVKAHIYESKAASGSGNFECPGLPNAHAGAPVIVSGFGTGIDGEWKAESVEKSITAQGGFTTTVNVNAGKEQKGAKS